LIFLYNIISNNEYIELEKEIDDFNFENNINELIFLKDNMIESSIEYSTLLNSSSNSKGKTTLAVWEFMYKKHNDKEKVIAIICNLYKKKYEPKTFIRLLIDYINKEYKHNISVK